MFFGVVRTRHRREILRSHDTSFLLETDKRQNKKERILDMVTNAVKIMEDWYGIGGVMVRQHSDTIYTGAFSGHTMFIWTESFDIYLGNISHSHIQ